MSQPIIKVPKTRFDYLLIGLSMLGLLVMVLFLVIYQGKRPSNYLCCSFSLGSH